MLYNQLFTSFFSEEINGVEKYICADGKAIRIEKIIDETFFDDSVKLVDWLQSFQLPEMFYFQSRDQLFELIGLGCDYAVVGDVADEVRSQTQKLWQACNGFVFFGGMSFFIDDDSPEWKGFEGYRFVLPVIEITRKKNQFVIALNHFNSQNLDVETIKTVLINKLSLIDESKALYPESKNNQVTREIQIPEFVDWEKNVDRILKQIQDGIITKTVLSRKMVFHGNQPWDTHYFLRKLQDIEEDSFLFFFQTARGHAFFGRSPERLFSFDNDKIILDAIAGTRPRGRDSADDYKLEQELLRSDKEMLEHRIVTQFISEQLAQICDDVQILKSEKIIKLKHIQHLVTEICGTVNSAHDPLSIAELFHPTPAVGGYPQDESRLIIKDIESHSRGWYASPIGWMAQDRSEFVVGIRSALIEKDQLHVFGGAGIVAKSKATDEWQETKIKMENLLRIVRETSNG